MNIFRSTWLLILLALVLALSVPAATDVSATTPPAGTALASSATHCPTAAHKMNTQIAIQSPLSQWTSETVAASRRLRPC